MSFSVDGVTIVVPWYGDSIGDVLRAIDSIDRQSFSRDIEIVLCNDDSPRRATAQLEEALAMRSGRRARVVLCHHERQRGAAAARNTAAKRASHNWLLWVDADDELTPNALASMTAAIAPGVALVTAQCWVVAGGRRQRRRPEVYIDLAQTYGRTADDPLAHTIFSLHPQMIRRDAFERLGGFDESFQRAEVTDLFLRLVSERSIAAVRAVPEPLYLHHRRPGSLSAARIEMDRARRHVLLAYSRRQRLPIDDLELMGRCPDTGARHYAAVVAGGRHVPPYVEFDSNGNIHIAANAGRLVKRTAEG